MRAEEWILQYCFFSAIILSYRNCQDIPGARVAGHLVGINSWTRSGNPSDEDAFGGHDRGTETHWDRKKTRGDDTEERIPGL